MVTFHNSRAVGIIEKYFESMMVIEQDILGSEEAIKKFLLMVPDEQLRNKLEAAMLKYHKGTDRWSVFEETVAAHNKNKVLVAIAMLYCFLRITHLYIIQRQGAHLREEVMLQLTYPRLDINVSKQLNHLLKSPFCVHPKTGKICVPIDPRKVDDFSPETVPTLQCVFVKNRKTQHPDPHSLLCAYFQGTYQPVTG